jgi:small subunit ribosomal protein S15e
MKQLVHARARRRFQRGLKRRPMGLIKKLRAAKKEAGSQKPAMVKTHLRDMIIVPEMIGSVVGVYVSIKSCQRSGIERDADWEMLGGRL